MSWPLIGLGAMFFFEQLKWWGFVCVLIAIIIAILHAHKFMSAKVPWFTIWVPQIAGLILGGLILAIGQWVTGDRSDDPPITQITRFFGHLPSIIIALLVILLITYPYFLRGVTHWFSLAFLTNEPLRRTVERLAQQDIQVPTFVCAAFETEVFDPDHPRYIPPQTSYYRPNPKDSYWTIIKDSIWIPKYFSLTKLPVNDRSNALLASAALPFGVVAAVDIHGEEYVDGGVVDNVPVYPLISLVPCDELVVINLNPPDEGTEAFCLKRWQIADRLLRLSGFPFADFLPGDQTLKYREDNDPPRVIPVEKPAFWPRRIVCVHPERSLGGFVCGTMNFSASYSQRLIRLGHCDACRCIRDCALAPQ